MLSMEREETRAAAEVCVTSKGFHGQLIWPSRPSRGCFWPPLLQ